jgi:hypothetical protein
MTKSAIENQESSPDVPPHVNLFYCMGLVVNSVVRLASLWLLQLVVRWSISGLLLSGNVSREGIDWAISIVIYGTRVTPNAFYRTGCSECIDMIAMLTARRYYLFYWPSGGNSLTFSPSVIAHRIVDALLNSSYSTSTTR